MQTIQGEQTTKQNIMVAEFLESIKRQIFEWLNVELDKEQPTFRFVDDYNLTISKMLPNLVQGIRKKLVRKDDTSQVWDIFRIVKKKTGSPLVENMALSVGIKL
jgi:hypothetical protein